MNKRLERFFAQYNDYPKPLRKGKYTFVLAMIIPSVIAWLVFYVAVNLESILLAFQQFQGYAADGKTEIYKWGFGNFEKLYNELTSSAYTSGQFKGALRNTLFLFVVGNAIVFPLQFFISYYLYKRYAGTKHFMWILYLPDILSTVVMVTIFKNVVSANGLLNALSRTFGWQPMATLLTSADTARWMVLVYNTWVGFAGSFILLTAEMRRIPGELIEAATLDGINKWQEFFFIILPMIFPTVQILILQKVTGLLSADGPILLLTGGAADTTTIGFWFYNQVILSHSYEYPSAIGLSMTLVVAPLALLVRHWTNKIQKNFEGE